MGNVIDLADKLWTGELSTVDANPVTTIAGLEELAPGLAFVSSFGNVTAVATGDGLVLIDTGSQMASGAVHDHIRRWSDARVHTAIYTHGHIDHVFGTARFEAEAPLRVIAHEAVAPRFDRYKLTAGYNGAINSRQFGTPGLRWPTEYRYPDDSYRDALDVDVGGARFELRHDRGETDDHTWVWLPAHRALCTGDLFIWASPNCGNPQKAQRYPREWAAALRKMSTLDAELLLPGHGPPIVGGERVRVALDDTAALLETICDQTLAMMNAGARLDDVLHGIDIPDELLARPYLRPVYDEPSFVVRNIWRLYGGWYDGNPAHLKPAPDAALAVELVTLAGGVGAVADRAAELADAGEWALACHLIELASQSAPTDDAVHELRASIYGRRVDAETSLMAKGIFRAAARDRA